MTKHTPATPLPWLVGPAITKPFVSGQHGIYGGKKQSTGIADVYGYIENGRYIVLAANAYPRLVEALNGLLSERNAIAVELAKHTGITMTDHGERERCYALLRELGEAE